VQAASLTKTQPKALSGDKGGRSLRGAAGGALPAPGPGTFSVGPMDVVPDSSRTIPGAPPVFQQPPPATRGAGAPPSALGKIPLMKQAAPAPARHPVPEAGSADIDSELRQFMRGSTPPIPEVESPPSFDFELDVEMDSSSEPGTGSSSGSRRDAPIPRDEPHAALPAPDLSEPARLLPAELPVMARAAPLLIDVTPISLGVEVAGGFCDFLIRANTPVPCDRTRVFRTASDNQVAVRVRVVQGESERFSENTYLGDLELSGLRAAARGDVEVAVTFEIDADGILNVRAKEEASGRETIARMNLLGAQTDSEEVAAMMARQRKHEVA